MTDSLVVFAAIAQLCEWHEVVLVLESDHDWDGRLGFDSHLLLKNNVNHSLLLVDRALLEFRAFPVNHFVVDFELVVQYEFFGELAWLVAFEGRVDGEAGEADVLQRNKGDRIETFVFTDILEGSFDGV